MPICDVCKKDFKYNGFVMHYRYCKAKANYYKNPTKCLNPDCKNIIEYEPLKRRNKKFCCAQCSFTKERRKAIGEQTKRLLRETPEIFKNFGKVNRINIKYKQKNGKMVNLQSSYEKKVAIDLDKYNIKWKRPSYLNYIDENGKYRKYFPDFYLIDYNVYLDPKNDYLIKKDKQKIRRAKIYNNVKIFILNEKQLSWKEIKNLISSNGL